MSGSDSQGDPIVKRVLQCPTCLAKFNIDDSVAGKKVACSKCNATFTAQMFPYANQEILTDPHREPVEAEKPELPSIASPSPKKKTRGWFGKLKLMYLICMVPLALLLTIGPIFLQNNKEQVTEELLNYLTLTPDEKAEELTNRLKSFLPEKLEKYVKSQKPSRPAPPSVSYTTQMAIHEDKIKRAQNLRTQGKPLVDAWTESGLITKINIISGDVTIDPLAWQNRRDADTRIELVKTIGTQLQSKANMRMTVNLYCSETGKRLGTYHPAGEISLFE